MGEHKFNPTAIAAAAGRLPRGNQLTPGLSMSIQPKQNVIILPPDRIRQRTLPVLEEGQPEVVVTEILQPDPDAPPEAEHTWQPVPDGMRAVPADNVGEDALECVVFISTLCQHGSMVAPNGRPLVTQAPTDVVLGVLPLEGIAAEHQRLVRGG